MRRLVIVSALSLAAASALPRARSPSGCVTWVRSMSAAVSSRSPASRSRRSCSRQAACPRRSTRTASYQVEQMYVQYFLPQNRKGKLPLLLWHGGGLTGVTYETKPDGGDGWLNYFIRKGWDTYISDAVERGRSGWTSTFKGEPWPAAGRSVGALPHWPDRLVERRQEQARDLSGHPISGRCLRPVHEAGRAALAHHRRSDRGRLYRAGRQGLPLRGHGAQPVRLVRLQGAGSAARQGQGAGRGRADAGRRPQQGGAIKNTPILVVYGDNAKDHPRWAKIRQGGVDYAAALKAAGGSIDIVDLPDAGIQGNSHMVMMDRNSDQVADLIQKWLVGKGLAE